MPQRASISALTFLVALSAPPAADATFPGANGRIAYGYSVFGDCSEAGCADSNRIRTIAPAGGPWRRLGSGGNPAYSPDGRRIAFDDEGAVFVAAANGRRPTRVAEQATDPAWAPDGRALAFTRPGPSPDFDSDLYAIDLEGGAPRLLAHQAVQPTWSTSGDVAFVRYSGPNSVSPQGIYVAASDGSGERLLVTGEGRAPSWSPDGKRIVFIRRDAPYTISADGRGLRRVTRSGGRVMAPVWSPDGKRIALAAELGLYVVDAGGRNIRLVSRAKRHRPDRNWFEAPDWQPLPPSA